MQLPLHINKRIRLKSRLIARYSNEASLPQPAEDFFGALDADGGCAGEGCVSGFGGVGEGGPVGCPAGADEENVAGFEEGVLVGGDGEEVGEGDAVGCGCEGGVVIGMSPGPAVPV